MDDDLWQRARLGPAPSRDPHRRRREQARLWLGKQLHTWRTERRLNQDHAIDLLGLTGGRSRLSRLERGECAWTPIDLETVAAALDVDPDELLRQSIRAGDAPAAERAAFVEWATALDPETWGDVIAEVERARG